MTSPFPVARRLFGDASSKRALVLAVGGSTVLGAAPLMVERSVPLQFSALLVVLAFLVLGAIFIDFRREGDLLSPLALCGAFYLLSFVAGSIFYWFNPALGQDAPFNLPFGHEALTATVGLATLSWVGLALGYLLRPFGLLGIRPLKLDAPQGARVASLLLLYGVGWMARAAQVASGRYFHGGGPGVFTPAGGSTTNQLLFVLSLLPLVALAYLGVMALTSEERRWKRLYWVALAVEIAFFLPSGGRGQVATIAAMALTVAYYVRGRLPLKPLALGAALLVFGVFPVVFLYRGSGGAGGFTRAPVANFKQGAAAYTKNGPAETMFYGLGITFSRFSQVLVPAALLEQEGNTFSVTPGSTLVWSVTNFVPHTLWPDKPDVGNFAGDSAYAMGLTSARTTSVSTTQVGEMYLNFGVAGVLLGMFIVGAIYREVGEWLRERRTRPIVLALYAAFAYQILGTGESIVAVGLVGLIRTLLVIVFVVWVVSTLLAPRVEGKVARATGPLRLPGGVFSPR